jgi:hypothetical protein
MQKNNVSPRLPFLLFEMTMNSAETIARRWQMMVSGTCSPAEYQRMIYEKMRATQQMGAALLSSNPTIPKLLRPWHSGTRRNVKRLRKRK